MDCLWRSCLVRPLLSSVPWSFPLHNFSLSSRRDSSLFLRRRSSSLPRPFLFFSAFSFLSFRAFWPFPSDFLPLFYRGSRRIFLFLLLTEPSSSLASLVPKNDTVARSRRRCRDAFFSERKDDESSLSCSPSSRATSPYLGSCVKC